jgi:ABC-type transporter Mla subunit MlaD
VGDQLDFGLTTASSTLDNIKQTLLLFKDAINQVTASMETLEQTALHASKAVNDTRPLVTGAGEIVTTDVADAIENVQNTVAPRVDLAKTIDEAMTALSEFKIEQTILGFPLNFDLGIEYEPQVSLPQAVTDIAGSLAGMPEKLRALSGDIEAADENLGIISQDLEMISNDINAINASLAEIPGLLDSFVDNVNSAQIQIDSIRADLEDNWQLIKTGVVVLFIWLGLTQIAPFLWGYEMFSGRQIGGEDQEL